MANARGFETRQIHSGAEADPTTGARATPIYQTTSYVFRDTSHAAALFSLAEPGNIYTRIMNPTQAVLEARLTDLEGGVGALAVASGQAAETLAIMNIATAGDSLVSSSSLYGGTYNLFHYTLPKYGIDVGFVTDQDDLDAWRAAITPTTKALFAETIGNPKGDVLDIEGVAGVAHEAGVPLIVDNTVATPYLCRPLDFGADIVVHSMTKFIGGHGTSIGGIIIDGGTFDYSNGRFPGFTEPDPSYHGLVYWDALGRRLLHRQGAGAAAAGLRPRHRPPERLPHDPGRRDAVAAHGAPRGQRRAPWPSTSRPGTRWSGWPGPACRAASGTPTPRSTRRPGPGSIISFGITGGAEAGRKFVEALELHSHLANIGDVRSLAIHPATTTHSQLTEDEQRDTGVRPELIRLSVGLESIDDILADLDAGFRAAKG